MPQNDARRAPKSFDAAHTPFAVRAKSAASARGRLHHSATHALLQLCAPLSALAAHVLKPFRSCAIIRQPKDVLNRVEVDTGFNFDTVIQILLSEPQPCPPTLKEGSFALRFVVLSTGKPMLLLLPYLYDTSLLGNTLSEWEFINNKFASSRHKVEGFEDVGGKH
mmetsp:Transcript_89939/g.270351  ORF Transcript_89939/g.270351 Transcript_89939/m.270351 type:complete len:165 (+) Transcript_89939:248-742(+)